MPEVPIPTMSHDSRSCQSAAGQTSVTVSTSAVVARHLDVQLAATCWSSSEYTWYTLSRWVTSVDAGHEVERLVADLGVLLEAPRHVLERRPSQRATTVSGSCTRTSVSSPAKSATRRAAMASMSMGLVPISRRHAQAFSAGAGASAPIAGVSATNLCCWILPCSSSSPWNSASGRGGQPGM